MLKPLAEVKPISVRPVAVASWTASDDGAETATSMPTPAMTAFCTSSNEARDEVSSARSAIGSSSASSAEPITLSIALCRPTSSRTRSIEPSGRTRAAACSPPVCLNACCWIRSRSGRLVIICRVEDRKVRQLIA